MNTIFAELLRQPLIERLGWTLLHFLWQGVAIAAVFGGTLGVLRRRSANARYLAGCLALLLMVVAPAATFVLVERSQAPMSAATPVATTLPESVHGSALAAAAANADSNPASDPTGSQRGTSALGWRATLRTLATRLRSLLPGLVAAWFTGVLALFLRLFGAWVQTQRMKQRGRTLTDVAWAQRLTSLARQIGVSRPIRLLESALTEVPTVIGWLRPVILLPASALSGLSPQQLEAILAHELAHIRRHDYLVNMVQTLVETLLFYHPLVWWISRRIRQEREHCCDDMAVAICGDRIAYARALTTLEELRAAPAQLAMAAHGGSLLARIRRIVIRQEAYDNRSEGWPSLLILVGITWGLVMAIRITAIGAETAHPATADTDPRLKTFATQKRQQTEEFAAKLHFDVPPEAREFFRAAEAGDWNAVSNSYARIQRLTGQLETSITMPGYTNVLAVPVHEVRGAYDDFHMFDEPMLQKYADGILGSIPAGSIYLGGTDPGRFIITAVRDTAASPDIFILTQNALADSRYIDYLRLIDGERLSMPTTNDVQTAFQEYVDGIRARQKRGEPIGAGEQERVDSSGRVNVRGVEGVMAINGILTKWIFDHNRDKHEFYVEESYVIPWMFPYLEPHGLILKLNKEPMKELDPALVTQDRQFWDALSKELLADRHFTGNDAARKTFSKLRSAIGGLYAYRHLTNEAESVFKQAQELCPTSPEASFRLAQLYMEQSRLDDAIAVLKSLQQRDPSEKHIQDAIRQLEAAKKPRSDLERLEQAHTQAPRDVSLVIQLAQGYLRAGRRAEIVPLCESYLAQTNLSANDMLQIAQMYVSVNEGDRALTTLQTIISLHPQEGQAYYATALIHCVQGRTTEALDALELAIQAAPAFRDKARNDPQFGAIRNNPRFQKLIAP